MNKDVSMSAIELRDIMAKELRELSETTMEDRNIAKKIDKAKQIFNGSGKMIALAAYTIEANRIGDKGEILKLPESTKLASSNKQKG